MVFVAACRTRGQFHFCRGFLTVYSEALVGELFAFLFMYLFVYIPGVITIYVCFFALCRYL